MSFTVSCDHVSSEWQLENVEFADVSKGEWNEYRVADHKNEEGLRCWYAVAPKFGCGRDAPSPERAISSLLLASGVYHVRIR